MRMNDARVRIRLLRPSGARQSFATAGQER
jgi:hypothetical protein